MSRDEHTDRGEGRSGLISRRHAIETAGAGVAGVASLVWSLGNHGGRVATAADGNASVSHATADDDNASTSTVSAGSTSVSSVSGSEWLSIYRADEAAVLAHHEKQLRTHHDELSRPTPTATPTVTSTPTPTPTPEGSTTTHTLLFEGTDLETPLYVIEGPESGPTGFVVGGIHGDELSGYRAAGIVAEWGVERGTLVVLPAANPPAIERETRDGRNGDLNRKFPPSADTSPTTRLAQGLWSVVLDHDPDWLIDLHSSRGIWDSEGGGVGQAVFPTPGDPAERYAALTVEAVNETYGLEEELSYHVGNLLDGDRPMLAHRAGTALDLPAFILETTEVAALERQIDWHLYSVDVLLRLFDHGPIQ